jgi:hypothetical protein
MDTLPIALLESTFGWLQLGEISAAKLVCAHWSTCQGACPVVNSFPVAALVQLERIQVLRIEVTSKRNFGSLDRKQFQDLKELSLKLDASRVFPRTLHQLTLKSDFAQLLRHVEWIVELPHGGILTKLLSLPQLRSLVIHQAMFASGTRASRDCPLESLSLVDCRGLDLDFLADLHRLQALGFQRGTILPSAVPLSVRLRITQLDVTRADLLIWRDGSQLAVDLTGFPELQRLRLEAGSVGAGPRMSDLVVAIHGLKHLRQLDFRVRPHASWFTARLENLTSLDIEFAAWPFSNQGLASCWTLRHLVLRGVPAHLERLLLRQLALTRCIELQRLKLVGSSRVPHRLMRENLPDWIQCLELVSLKVK